MSVFLVLIIDFRLQSIIWPCLSSLLLESCCCMADPSYSNTSNCHCNHTYYGNSTDDSAKAPYGSKANPGFSCKDINTNNGKQNGIYWIRLTGMIQ